MLNCKQWKVIFFHKKLSPQKLIWNAKKYLFVPWIISILSKEAEKDFSWLLRINFQKWLRNMCLVALFSRQHKILNSTIVLFLQKVQNSSAKMTKGQNPAEKLHCKKIMILVKYILVLACLFLLANEGNYQIPQSIQVINHGAKSKWRKNVYIFVSGFQGGDTQK